MRTARADRFELWQVCEAAAGAGIGPAALRPELARERDLAAAAAADPAGGPAAMRARVNAGLARLYLGDLPGAGVDLAAAAQRATGWEGGYAAFGRGVLAVAGGDATAGATHFGRAGRVLAGHGDHRGAGYALHRQGLALAAAGDPGAARDRLRRALELFRQVGDRFGMLAVLHAAAPEPAGLPEPAALPVPGGPGPEVLTPRQREVAELIATGLTNRQIAERIVVAERTVDTHVQCILARLNCASRVQIALLVAANGGQPIPVLPVRTEDA